MPIECAEYYFISSGNRLKHFPQDRTTVYQENSTWSNLMLSIQPDETANKDWDRTSFHRQRREYHVHSHLFQNLDADSRYEVIIQSKNKFGWSEPTKSFIFSTRLRGQKYADLCQKLFFNFLKVN